MPDLADIHAKRVDPQKVSELIFEDLDESGTFADMEIEPLDGQADEAPSSPVQIELPQNFGKKSRSNSFDNSRRQESVKSPRRHSADNFVLYDDEEEAEAEEPEGEPKTYNPSSPKTIKYWTPRRKGLGYFVNMKSPEEKKISKTRRNEVNDFLTQYLEDMGLDVDEEDLIKPVGNQGEGNAPFNKSSPAIW